MVRITNRQLADIIGIEPGFSGRINIKPEDLPKVKLVLRTLQISNNDASFLIDDTMPHWLYVAVMAALAPNPVTLTTSNVGQVAIPRNTPEGTGSGLTFRVYEDHAFTLVQFSTPRYLSVEQLATIIPPQVNQAKGVVISSNTPPWIVCTVALAYAQAAPWVALTQKDDEAGAIICAGQSRAATLGSEIERAKLNAVMYRARAPKRGEIWSFDDGYKERPGVIISPTLRNEQLNDVLIVPFTTSDSHAHWHLPIPAAGTGLAQDSYAQCANITRLEKEHLIKGPLGSLPEHLLAQVIRGVRQAIGDDLAA